VRIGSDVVITGNSAVARDVPDKSIMMGYPAVRMDQNIEMYKALRRLPRLVARLERAQKPVPKREGSD
jgi:UDP-3-O-[3-hydroxymyristoyl] glucosamine N-acyltransferase